MQRVCNRKLKNNTPDPNIVKPVSLEEAWQILVENETKIRQKLLNRVRRDLKDDFIQELYSILPTIYRRWNPEFNSFRNYLFVHARYSVLSYCNKMTKLADLKTKVYNFDDAGIKIYAEKSEKFIYENKEYFDFEEYAKQKYNLDIDIINIVSKLSSRHRIVFILRFIFDLKNKDIERIMSIGKKDLQNVIQNIRYTLKNGN